jgi:hypothetical protein
MLEHVGERLLGDPVGGLIKDRREQPWLAGALDVEVEAGRSALVEQVVEVGEADPARSG